MKSIFLIFAILLASCGTRKVNKTEEKLAVTKKDTTEAVFNASKVENKSQVEKSTTDENIIWDYSKGTLSPIDPEKPMTHTDSEGKTNTWTNAKIDFSKESGNSTKHEETIKEVKTETKDTSVIKINSGSSKSIKKETTKKETNREGFGVNIWSWAGIAIALCIIVWFLWFFIIRKKQNDNELL